MTAVRWAAARPQRDRFIAYAILDGLSALVAFTAVIGMYAIRCRCVRLDLDTVGLAFGFSAAVVAICKLARLYRPLLRYRDLRLIWRVMRATIPAAALPGLSVIYLLPGVTNEILVFPLWICLFGLTLVWRLIGTNLFGLTFANDRSNAVRVVIYGAGQAGQQLAEVLQGDPQHAILGFVDDNHDLQERTIRDLPIYPPTRLRDLAARRGVDQVVLALPSISAGRRREILDNLSRIEGLRVTTLPPLTDIMSGRIATTTIRDVSAEELLSRDPVTPDLALIRQELTGRSVLVTGGGGSIGSALCREILRHRPSKLIILDASEPALYHIDQELTDWLREAGHPIAIVPVLCSVLNTRALNRAIREHDVEILYHAAAYKHVPLVESNVGAGIENNVFGTLNAAQAAVRNNVHKFVLVSTDKAVRPTSIMGASKRMAEMVIDAIARRHPGTQFALVRFGNVLDSAGSVVPRFRRQIADGGPITITHPEMVRYFMTIPEAAELVIQAGAMARSNGADVFHLDMGEPVRVLDLARRLISLSGLTVREPGSDDGDIEIEFTGARPGEKLYEELLVDGEAVPTEHQRIFRADDVQASWARTLADLKALRDSLREGDPARQRAVIAACIGHAGLNTRPELPDSVKTPRFGRVASGWGRGQIVGPEPVRQVYGGRGRPILAPVARSAE